VTESRTISFDLANLPACHRCGAPAIIERDASAIVHVSWNHEHDCPVPGSTAERIQLDAALAESATPESAGGVE